MLYPILILVLLAILVVLITGFWHEVAQRIMPDTVWGLYSRDFFENVLVEAHGGLIDLFVVGIILYWFQRRSSTKEQISHYQEILNDLRNYQGDDVSYRSLGTLKRLLALEVNPLQLSEVNLSNLEIKGLAFQGNNLHAVNFTNSRITKVKFDDCNCDAAIFVRAKLSHVEIHKTRLRRAKFLGASLNGVDFSSCKIESANFTNADLKSSIFKGVDCKGVTFKDANLQSANFVDARNLTAKMLLSAKCIKFAKTNDVELKKIIEQASVK